MGKEDELDSLTRVIMGVEDDFGLGPREASMASLLGSIMLVHTTGFDFSRKIVIVEAILEIWRKVEELNRKGEI